MLARAFVTTIFALQKSAQLADIQYFKKKRAFLATGSEFDLRHHSSFYQSLSHISLLFSDAYARAFYLQYIYQSPLTIAMLQTCASRSETLSFYRHLHQSPTFEAGYSCECDRLGS